jgi:hypothetical protein
LLVYGVPIMDLMIVRAGYPARSRSNVAQVSPNIWAMM